MVIENNSLEVLRECRYVYNDELKCLVSDNLYMSIVVTNACQCSCPYCINSNTDKYLSMPFEKGKENIRKAVEKFGIKEAVILGGEPTLYNYLVPLIKFLKEEMKLRKVGLTTNGIRLKEDNFLIDLIGSGVDFINVSYHRKGEFLRHKELVHIYNVFKKYRMDGQKMRINTNIWRGNHDNLHSLENFIKKISPYCDEVRVSNIIRKDGFSVNKINRAEAESMYMKDEEYEKLFNAFLGSYQKDYSIIYNPRALGFVKYYLVPAPTPIILNWNIDSKVSEQICENDLEEKKIHTIKCLVSGDISMSWNLSNKIEMN